jgi:hypothetical protein
LWLYKAVLFPVVKKNLTFPFITAISLYIRSFVHSMLMIMLLYRLYI